MIGRPTRRALERALAERSREPSSTAHRGRVLAAVEMVLEDAARPPWWLSIDERRALLVSGLAAVVACLALVSTPAVGAADPPTGPKPRSEWRWIDSRAMLGTAGLPGI